jgi:hypothetical protein
MATLIGSTNVSISKVKEALGSALNSLFDLGTLATINKWSKYKPVRGTWPASSNGRYGLSIPRWHYTNNAFYFEQADQTGSPYNNTVDNWWLLHPRGGSPGGTPDEPVRLGDFRGYEHSPNYTQPPIHCLTDMQDENASLNPAQPDGGFSGGGAVVRCNVSNGTDITLTVGDIALEDYYFGILISCSDGKFIKTNINPLSSGNLAKGQWCSYNCYLLDDSDSSSAYGDLPYAVGTFNLSYIICDEPFEAWTNLTVATNRAIYLLPTGNQYQTYFKNAFSLTVTGWLKTAVNSFYWTNSQQGAGTYQSTKVMLSGTDDFTVNLWDIITDTAVTWLSYTVYAADQTTQITNPALWHHGCFIRFYPNSVNGGLVRQAVITIGAYMKPNYPVSVVQHGSNTWNVNFSLVSDNINRLTISSDSISGSPYGIKISFTPDNPESAVIVKYNVGYAIFVNSVMTFSSDSSADHTTPFGCQDAVAISNKTLSGGCPWVSGDTVVVKLYKHPYLSPEYS